MADVKEPIAKVLISEREIEKRVYEIAKNIDDDYAGKTPLILGVLNGSFIFVADLVRALGIHASICFVQASSYGTGTTSTGTVEINRVKGFDPEGQDIIIVEDIVDTGRTLSKLREYLFENGAKSVEICTFLDKPSRRVVDITPKYVGFEIPDEFVVGYGLDYAYKYRQYPFVGVLKAEYCE